MLKFIKVRAGWYVTEDGHWAVVSDGYGHVTVAEREGDGIMCGMTGGQWATCYDPKGQLRLNHQAGENLDWFDTKREAVALANSEAKRMARA